MDTNVHFGTSALLQKNNNCSMYASKWYFTLKVPVLQDGDLLGSWQTLAKTKVLAQTECQYLREHIFSSKTL